MPAETLSFMESGTTKHPNEYTRGREFNPSEESSGVLPRLVVDTLSPVEEVNSSDIDNSGTILLSSR
jgi:hypothetical protein